MVIANKRLCQKAARETRETVQEMCDKVLKVCSEFTGLLVPMCAYHGGKCHEMNPCKKETGNKINFEISDEELEKAVETIKRYYAKSGETTGEEA